MPSLKWLWIPLTLQIIYNYQFQNSNSNYKINLSIKVFAEFLSRIQVNGMLQSNAGYCVCSFNLGDWCNTFCGSSDVHSATDVVSLSIPSTLQIVNLNFLGTCVFKNLLYIRYSMSYSPICFMLNLLKPTGHMMHQQFNSQQLYVLPTLYLCVLYLSENKQRLVPLTA